MNYLRALLTAFPAIILLALTPVIIAALFPAFDMTKIAWHEALWLILWVSLAILGVQVFRLIVDLKHYDAIRQFNILLDTIPRSVKETRKEAVKPEGVKRKRGRPPKNPEAVSQDKPEKPEKKRNLLYTT